MEQEVFMSIIETMELHQIQIIAKFNEHILNTVTNFNLGEMHIFTMPRKKKDEIRHFHCNMQSLVCLNQQIAMWDREYFLTIRNCLKKQNMKAKYSLNKLQNSLVFKISIIITPETQAQIMFLQCPLQQLFTHAHPLSQLFNILQPIMKEENIKLKILSEQLLQRNCNNIDCQAILEELKQDQIHQEQILKNEAIQELNIQKNKNKNLKNKIDLLNGQQRIKQMELNKDQDLRIAKQSKKQEMQQDALINELLTQPGFNFKGISQYETKFQQTQDFRPKLNQSTKIEYQSEQQQNKQNQNISQTAMFEEFLDQ